MKRVGAVVVFKPGVTPEEAALLLDRLERSNANSYGLAVEASDIQEYDDNEGTCGPVFYIP